MTANLSFMIIPSGSIDTPPQFLMEQNGMWRDMSSPVSERPVVSGTEVKEKIDRVLSEVMQAFENGTEFRTNSPYLRSTFKASFDLLFPSKVRQILAQEFAKHPAPPTLHLHIHPYNEWIPWEILHDGEDFLGLRYQIARLPIVERIPDIAVGFKHHIRKVCHFLGDNVFTEQTEIDALRPLWDNTFKDFLNPATITKEPNGNNSSYPTAESIINGRDADILHITCHGGVKNPANGELGWSLNEKSGRYYDYHLGETFVKEVSFESRPLVFGNACSSSAANGLVSGLGAFFYASGALNFIGTLAPISKKLAVEFAREFYMRLIGIGDQNEKPIGQALLETKQHFFGKNDGDPSYLFYCLYGPPDTTYSKNA